MDHSDEGSATLCVSSSVAPHSGVTVEGDNLTRGAGCHGLGGTYPVRQSTAVRHQIRSRRRLPPPADQSAAELASPRALLLPVNSGAARAVACRVYRRAAEPCRRQQLRRDHPPATCAGLATSGGLGSARGRRSVGPPSAQ